MAALALPNGLQLGATYGGLAPDWLKALLFFTLMSDHGASADGSVPQHVADE